MKQLLLILMMLFMFVKVGHGQEHQEIVVKVYFDYVMQGNINSPEFVSDGRYSYHIVGFIPRDVFWELYPLGSVYLIRRDGAHLGKFHPEHRWVFRNRRLHHEIKPIDDRRGHKKSRKPRTPKPRRR